VLPFVPIAENQFKGKELQNLDAFKK